MTGKCWEKFITYCWCWYESSAWRRRSSAHCSSSMRFTASAVLSRGGAIGGPIGGHVPPSGQRCHRGILGIFVKDRVTDHDKINLLRF